MASVQKIREILKKDKGYYDYDHAISPRVIKDILSANKKADNNVKKLVMEKVKITLTLEEAHELYQLVKESSDTGNFEWDEKMKSIEEKLRVKI